jgi:MFS family permease
VLLATSHRFLLSEIILPLTGFGMMTTVTGCNTILQHIVDEDMRGRVMSLFTLAVMGTMPLGSLFIGWFAQVFSAQDATLFVSAFAFAYAGYAFRRTREMNPFSACAGAPCEVILPEQAVR